MAAAAVPRGAIMVVAIKVDGSSAVAAAAVPCKDGAVAIITIQDDGY